MFATLKSILQSLFGNSGDSSGHPLDRPEEEHRVKKREANQELERLREERDQLKEKLAEKKAEAKSAKEAGNKERAQDHLSDADEIEEKLEVVRGQINETQQQRNFVGNLVRARQIRSTHSDDYWHQLKEMNERELFEWFSEEEMETEEMLSTLEKGTKAGNQVTTGYTEKTESMSSTPDVEERLAEDESDTSSDTLLESETSEISSIDDENSDEDIKMG